MGLSSTRTASTRRVLLVPLLITSISLAVASPRRRRFELVLHQLPRHIAGTMTWFLIRILIMHFLLHVRLYLKFI